MLSDRAQRLHTFAINTPPFGPERHRKAADLAKSLGGYTRKGALEAFLPVVKAAAEKFVREEGGRAPGQAVLAEVAKNWAELFETEHGIGR